MKNIGILTQPLGHNYGGILQAYALQEVLRRKGHIVETLDFQQRTPMWRKFASLGKRIFLNNPINYVPYNARTRKLLYQNTKQFIDKHIKISKRLNTPDEVNDYYAYKQFDAIIVGSDQVWREKFSPHLPTFFLEFLPAESSTKRIAYAASYGSGTPISPKTIDNIKSYANQFDAISVRESDAVQLTEKLFRCQSIRVLDPTLLLTPQDYTELIKFNSSKSDGDMFVYVLDRTKEKMQIINSIARERKLVPYELLPKDRYLPKDLFNYSDEFILPSVEQWIRSIADAKFVITDSFHGTAFSILYNKPFISLANATRGISRFTSLLNLFDLSDRLITSEDQNSISDSIFSPDFENANSILSQERRESFNFLDSSLE